jgi:hypothetical protein
MWDWLLIIVLYFWVAGFFRWLGGFSAAGSAIREWGRASATIRTGRTSPNGS